MRAGQALKLRRDLLTELVMDRPLFAAALCRATKDHGLRGLGIAGELDLDTLTDGAPAVRIGEFRGEPLQL